ncbi:MAG: hypothetical protein HPAVJP_5190 [Candidatus Hepatoplasma vulgare]|nr:MAG: hypothetical protein HPAVJP_5190 [Candidatus Hepatoplasma sp.]
MYKVEDLRNKSEKELLNLISEVKGKLLSLRFENATGQLTETHLISVTRKDIAKIFTVLKEKQGKISLDKFIKDKKDAKRKFFKKEKQTVKEDSSKIEKDASKKIETTKKEISNSNKNIDYTKLTVKDIKDELKKRNITFVSSLKKDELISLLLKNSNNGGNNA